MITIADYEKGLSILGTLQALPLPPFLTDAVRECSFPSGGMD